jgi:glycosyltransferase involved in cell wall biosynthesis
MNLVIAGGSRPSGVPRVSIIVPAYNRERYLGDTIGSVLAQTLTSWELVVSDDGSTDTTAEVARAYTRADSRIKLVSGTNGGVAAARNRGFIATDRRSEFVIFLDSDDRWEPDALETLVGVLESSPEYISVHCIACCVDAHGRAIAGDDLQYRMRRRIVYRQGRIEHLALHEPTTFAALCWGNCVLNPGTQLVRREIVERVGGFDVATDPADDWDMALRVSRCGDIGFVDRPLLQWRRHVDTLTNTSARWRRANIVVRRKALLDPSNSRAQTAAARRAYVESNWEAVRALRECIVDQRYRDVVRVSAKAVHHCAIFLRADLTVRIRATSGFRRRRAAR